MFVTFDGPAMCAAFKLFRLCPFREARRASCGTLGTPFHICVVFDGGMITNMMLVLQAGLGLFRG